MYGVRTKKVASYGKRAQRYVAVSEDRRFGMGSKTETPTQLSDWSPPSPESIYSPSPAKAGQRKVSRKTAVGKTGGKGVAVRRPLGLLPSNHQVSPLVPPKATTSKKSYSSLGIGSPLSLRSPFVELEISVIDDSGRKVSEEKRRTNLQPSFKATAHKRPARSPIKRLRKPIPIIVDSDDDSDSDFVLSPLPKRSKNPRKTARVPPVDKRKSNREQVQITHTPESIASSSSPDVRVKSPMVSKRKMIVSDSEPEIVSEPISKAKSDHKPTTATSNKQQSTNPSFTTAKPPPAFPQTPCKVAPEIHDHAPASSTATLTPFPLLRPQDHRSEDYVGVDTNIRPLTPLKPSASKFPSMFPADFYEDRSDSSISLDLSIDLELELALKVAQVNLRDIPSTSRPICSPRKVPVVEIPVVAATSKYFKASRSSGSSQLRPSLKKKVPNFLRPLLSECGQEAPFDFQEFVEVFPFDQIHTNSNNQRTSLNPLPTYQKVGEASYSEVFGIGDVVLKIVPLMDEEREVIDLCDPVERPSMSEAKDVLKEIIVTRALGNVCDGFTKLLRSHVVQGSFPEMFLALWDEYNERKGSESIRPDSFSSSQSYVVIILPHGGPDLEAFSFDSDVCWQQASCIFWQVTKSLARAEELVHFEHRDLHWGQILVSKAQRKRDAKGGSSIDLRATIIDLGLSRIDYINEANLGDVCWTPFADEIFEGEGEYQYDVYRMMREHNKNEWVGFQPLTNVMWLHYLCDKLLHRKNLKIPAGNSRSVATLSTRSSRKTVSGLSKPELTAYIELKAVESALSEVLRPIAQRASRKLKSTQGRKSAKNSTAETADNTSINSAQDVLQLAKSQGWTF